MAASSVNGEATTTSDPAAQNPYITAICLTRRRALYTLAMTTKKGPRVRMFAITSLILVARRIAGGG